MTPDEQKELHKQLLDAMNIHVFGDEKQMPYSKRLENLHSIGAEFGLTWEETQWEMFKARLGQGI